MPAYMIVQHNDNPELGPYREAATAANAEVGARVITNGASARAIEGEWPFDRLTIVEFPDLDTAEEFYSSGEYRRVKALRDHLPSMNIVLVDGIRPG